MSAARLRLPMADRIHVGITTPALALRDAG
jgi:hypothetical protein